MLLLDLHTGFSGGRLGHLVFPSLSEVSLVCCDPHKDFSVLSEAEVDVFQEFSCFFYDLMNVINLISGSSASSKSSLYIWKFLVRIRLKPSLKDFEHQLASMWNEHSCALFWTFFGIAFPWDWNKNWPFPVLWLLLSFPNLLAYWVKHFHSIIF